MKKQLLLILIGILLFPLIGNALVKPSNNLYVTDTAKVLSNNTEEYIIKYSDYLSKVKKIRFYVVTVPYLENLTIEKYSDYVFNEFKMGNYGVLVFFSKEENAVQIVMGSKIGKSISDKELEEYIDNYFIPYFKNTEWDKGIKNGYNALYKKICSYYHIDSNSIEINDGNSFLIKYQMPILTGLIFLGIIIGYSLCSFFKRIYLRRLKSFFDYASFGIVFVLNIALLITSYYINFWYLLLVLGIELFMMITLFDTSKSMSLEEAFIRIKQDEKKRSLKKKKKIMKKRK